MSTIKPLGSVTLSEDTDTTSGVVLYEVAAPGDFEIYPLSSVLISNTTSVNGAAYVWFTSPALSDVAVIAYNLPLSGYNTYETFRFAMGPESTLYVAGTEGMSFYLNGILQEVTPTV